MILLAAAAFALDATGPAAVPATEAAAPQYVWVPSAIGTGRWALSLSSGYVDRPVVETVSDVRGAQEEARSFGVSTLAGYVSLERVGIGADLPLCVGDAGVGLCDATVWLPVRLTPGDGGFGVLAVAEGQVPLGDPDTWTGSGGGGGLRLVAGTRTRRFGWSAELGGHYAHDAVRLDVDQTWALRAGLDAEVHPVDRLGLGVEAWLAASPWASTASSPGEVLGRVGVELGRGFGLSAGGGAGFTGGVGAGDYRLWVRLGFAPPSGHRGTVATPVVETPAAPPNLVVAVRDVDGAPLPATVRVTGDSTATMATAADGTASFALPLGHYAVTVASERKATETWGVVLDADRFRPARVEAVLPASEAGLGSLAVDVRDTTGTAVEGAQVRLDGVLLGTTSSGGTLAVDGLVPRERLLSIDDPDFRAADPVKLQTGPGSAQVLTLQHSPGSVRVRVRGPVGPVGDALVAFTGPSEHVPEAIGPDGERVFVLEPGEWSVAVSAKSFGLQERDVHIEPGQLALVDLVVALVADEGGDNRLTVHVVDPDGAAVEGARVRVDGVALGATANGGTLTIGGLRGGTRRLEVDGVHFRPSAPRVLELAGGERQEDVVLGWNPGTLRVVARGAEGAVADAQVLLEGPVTLPPTDLGPDGEALFSLAPGAWHLSLTAASYGLQERDLVVRADDTQLVEVDAALLAKLGDSALEARVTGPDGAPVVGATIGVDGRTAGTTGSAGTLTVGGLVAGAHVVQVGAEAYGSVERTVDIGAGETRVDLALGWAPTAVRVRARGPDGPATDALAAFFGPTDEPPRELVPAGERVFALEPGVWTLVVSSARYGLAQQDVTVVAGGGSPQVVDVALRPPAVNQADLLVTVVDPAGRAIHDVTLWADGSPQLLGAHGVAIFTHLDPGHLELRAEAPGFRPGAPVTVALPAGVRAHRLRLQWSPRPVEVAVTDAEGRIVPARVTMLGPGRPVTVAVGADGIARTVAVPGRWQVLVEADGFGASRQELTLDPGTTAVRVKTTLGGARAEVQGKEVSLKDPVLFDTAQATIRPESYALLEQVAAVLLLHPELTRVEVQGHTDTVGTPDYNLDLSQRRAESVVAWLVQRGVDPGRLHAVGYGDTRPIDSNDTEPGRARNRRVQFELR